MLLFATLGACDQRFHNKNRLVCCLGSTDIHYEEVDLVGDTLLELARAFDAAAVVSICCIGKPVLR